MQALFNQSSNFTQKVKKKSDLKSTDFLDRIQNYRM